MLKKERQAFIVHQVHLHNKVLSSTLSREIDVSEDTIRRDLQELAGNGKLIKVHGGALSTSYSRFYDPPADVYLQNQKQVIAQKAAALVKDGMCVMTSGGSTISELARALPTSLHATFFSASIPAVIEYMNHPGIEVVLIGDRLAKRSGIAVGGEAIARIHRIKADLCFLGVNAFDPVHGVTDSDWDVVQVKKAMVQAARKVICLTVSEKLNTLKPIHICNAQKVDVLITERSPLDPLLKPYIDSGIQVL